MKRSGVTKHLVVVVTVLLLVAAACGGGTDGEKTDGEKTDTEKTDTEKTGTQRSVAEPPGVVSAFFGLDDALPGGPAMTAICPEAPGLDGMPVVLGSEIDTDTLDPADFEVVRASGAVGEVVCVTMRPASDLGEVRTTLLVGQFGSDDDPPVSVRIVGELLAVDGDLDLEGSEVEVTPLVAGPSIVLASVMTADERAASAAQEERGSCVADPAVQVVRVTWDGGIKLPSGAEPSAADVGIYQVTVTGPDGSTSSVTALGFADLGDNDNVHELCIAGRGRPSSVSAVAGAFVDPRGDLNPSTSVEVSAVRA